MEVTLLGTGAPLAPDRATLGLLARAENGPPVLLDACGGFELTRRLVRHGVALDAVRDVVVTHRHFDHIGGLTALLIAAPSVRVHGPPDALDAVRVLFATGYPHLAEALDLRPSFVPWADGERRTLGGLTITAFAVRHRVPTLALRVEADGAVLAYSADTLPCPALTACARGADLFVCDALCAEADGPDAAARAARLMHPTARQAAALARDAGVRRLALVHLARFATVERVAAEARAAYGEAVDVPDDGVRTTLG